MMEFKLQKASCFWALAWLAALGGCTPYDYRAGPIDLPTPALEAAIADAAAEDAIEYTTCPSDEWWTLFDDVQLTSFVEMAFVRNPTLQKAYANILLASANADRVRSVLFPNILWAADVSRQKLSETGLIPFAQTSPPGIAGPAPAQLAAAGGTAGIPVYFTQSETEFNLSYDFDIWGKNRNTWAAALSEVQSNIADEAFARLQLGIAVAQVYYQLQTDYQLQAIADRLVQLHDSYLSLTNDRLENSLDSAQNVQSAKTNLSSARQSLLQIQGDIAVNENKLRTYLAGQFDEPIFRQPIEKKPLPHVPLPCDLPLHLIAHRPDIVAQLWLIESAGKQIEVAKAGFYPDVNINALFGFQTIHLHKWFEWPSVFFNVDPAVSLPFFDGGRLAANLRGSEINYDLAIFEYNEKILNAVHEVLDGLAVLRNTQQQLQEYQNKLDEQEELFKLALLRAEHNLNSDLDTNISEAQLLAVRNDEVVAMGRSIQAILLLIKAMGGGYEACYLEG